MINFVLLTELIMRKQRSDKGKHRFKYDKSLPPKYKSYLQRCNNKGISFNISIEEFEQITSMNCAYCGQSGYGIDRINPKLGYEEGNIVPCCTKCNMMKYSTNDFLSHIKRIYEYQNTIS